MLKDEIDEDKLVAMEEFFRSQGLRTYGTDSLDAYNNNDPFMVNEPLEAILDCIHIVMPLSSASFISRAFI